jgi:hypothetical protein
MTWTEECFSRVPTFGDDALAAHGPPDERPAQLEGAGTQRQITGFCRLADLGICTYFFLNGFTSRIAVSLEWSWQWVT